MSGQPRTAFCKFGQHYVQRSTTVSVRIGDMCYLTCPEHRELAEELAKRKAEIAPAEGVA